MTEKRFTLDEYLGIGSVVIDTENENVRFKHENKLSMKQCCDLLNEQHETIQRLKENIDELLSVNVKAELEAELNAKNFQILYEQYKDALKIIKNLKKENEQLKTK